MLKYTKLSKLGEIETTFLLKVKAGSISTNSFRARMSIDNIRMNLALGLFPRMMADKKVGFHGYCLLG